MEKILLVGSFDNSSSGIQNELMKRFQVQICVPVYRNIAGMIRVVKPQLLLLSQTKEEKLDVEIFKGLVKEWPDLKVLVVCSPEDYAQLKGYAPDRQFTFMYYPLRATLLLMKCENLMGTEQLVIEETSSHEYDFNTKPRILVVDDSPMVLRNIKMLLDEYYEVKIITSGAKAVTMIMSNPPDLILLDYDMPEMDGLTVFKQLKKIQQAKDIPVLFLTGVSDKDRIVKALNFHPAGYILKPLNEKRILSNIKEILGR